MNVSDKVIKTYIPYGIFPEIKFFRKVYRSKEIVIIKQKRYSKKSKINSYNILGPQGRITLTVPMLGGRKTKVKTSNLFINNGIDWQLQHWKTFCSCYNRSPLFEYYKDEFYQTFFQQKILTFDDFVLKTIGWVLKKLKTKHSDIRIEYVDDQLVSSSTLPVSYQQTFSNKYAFVHNISILDMLYNVSPNDIEKFHL